jgi:subtilisin family serine protease
LGGNGGSSDQIAQAIQWAVNGGAHVISMSLGIDFPGYAKQLLDQGVPAQLCTSLALEGYRSNILLFERLASFIAARGLMAEPTLLVAAAGNESRRDEQDDFAIGVSPPAVADDIVSVAALGQSNEGLQIASFSNRGARISAPGIDIVSARLGGGLATMDGTSMATPHVAGVAALWAEKLMQEGDFRGRTWSDRLFGAATRTSIKPGYDPNDIGSGLVFAPTMD